MEVRFSQSDYAHDTGCPQCARMKSDEEDDFIIDGIYAIEFNCEYWHGYIIHI